MKGVRCSWVDMQRIREALAAGARGDQKRLEHMRCVDHATVSAWKAVCDLMNALEGKCLISNKERFQPSHAAELARHFRKRERNSSRWTEAMKEEIVDWIERVEAEGLTVREVREQLWKASCPVQSQDKGCTPATLQELLDAGQRFGCIYADPPWQYGNQATRAATSNHYQTMPTEEIAALPVKALAADLAHLHLWTTNAFLSDALRLVEVWGFDYKGMFIWCKSEMGLGNYWRVSHELLLLGVRGNLEFNDKGLKSWKEISRSGKHSAKPEPVRHLVEKASPGPRLELFGRDAVSGWTVWGNQVSRDLFHQEEKEET